jgi:hypothetical protein
MPECSGTLAQITPDRLPSLAGIRKQARAKLRAMTPLEPIDLALDLGRRMTELARLRPR